MLPINDQLSPYLSPQFTGLLIHIHLNTHQHALIDGLLQHEDLRERLSAVVERTRRSPRLTSAQRLPAHRVAGCASDVWLIGELTDARCIFRSDADSAVVRGLVALTADFFSGARPEDIVATVEDPLELLDLKRSLSPTRRHGLAAVVSAIRQFAESQLPRESTTSA